MPTPPDHATPQARLYSRECFEAIGGMPPFMGADMITNFRAQMHGYRTVTFRWTTHSAGGITERDRELAAKTDELIDAA